MFWDCNSHEFVLIARVCTTDGECYFGGSGMEIGNTVCRGIYGSKVAFVDIGHGSWI